MVLSTCGNHWAIFLMPKRQFLTSSVLIPMLYIISIWLIWILFIFFIGMICLSSMMVTMPLSITWKLIFRMGVVLWTYYFSSVFPNFSYLFLHIHASFMDLVVFIMQWLSYCTDTLLSSFSHMTNENIPWSRPPCTTSLSHIHLHPVESYVFHFWFFSSMSWLCHSLFISICFHFQGCLSHVFNLCLWFTLTLMGIEYGLIQYILVDPVHTCTYILSSI